MDDLDTARKHVELLGWEDRIDQARATYAEILTAEAKRARFYRDVSAMIGEPPGALSAAHMAALMRVSRQTVYQWKERGTRLGVES